MLEYEDEDEAVPACAEEAILRRHLAPLMEHFDSVRIFATRMDRSEGGPVVGAHSIGGGNFYASMGQVREWLIRQEHRARVEVEREDEEASA